MHTAMPVMLIILCVLLGCLGAFAGFNGQWLSAAVNIGLAIGLLRANDTVRKIAIGLHVLGLVGVVVNTLALMTDSVAVALIVGGIQFAILGFGIFVLTRQSVVHWMLQRGMADLESKAGGPHGF